MGEVPAFSAEKHRFSAEQQNTANLSRETDRTDTADRTDRVQCDDQHGARDKGRIARDRDLGRVQQEMTGDDQKSTGAFT